jgi:phenylpropionate dioxygenase-like ring-hydroxylating dioxygenase large terminal subunit
MKSVFVRDCWYVAAWDFEIPAEGMVSRTILNEPIVIFRKQDGGLSALADRCAHRGFPLSVGRREGDSLRCAYHGFKFDSSGACTEIPGKDRVPEVVCAKRYAAVQRDSWIWIWMGDYKTADESLIPRSWSLQDAAWSTAAGQIDYQAYYELVNDNLTDLSHLAYVHANSIGGAEWGKGADRLSELPRGVRVERWSIPQVESNVPGQGMAEQWTAYDHLAPGVFLMGIHLYPPGSAARFGLAPPLEEAISSSITWQAVTPTTNTTTRYFFAVGQPHGGAMDGPTALNFARIAFEEDRLCIEAQQRNLDLTGDRMILAGHDEAPIGFRRVLARLARGKDTGSPPVNTLQVTTHAAWLA